MPFPVFTVEPGRIIKRDGVTLCLLGKAVWSDDPGVYVPSPATLDDFTRAVVERLNGVTLDREVATLLARVLDPSETTDKVDLVAVRAALNFALQDAPGDKQGAERRLADITPEQRARHARDVAQVQGVATYQGHACLAYVDRMGGVVITDTTDGRNTYIQPGDDASRLIAELDAAEATPETKGWEDGSNDKVEAILREYF